MITGAQYLAAAGCLAAAIAWHILIFRLAARLRLIKPNFAGRPIMSSYGVVLFGYVAAAVGALALLGYASPGAAELYLVVMGAMCVLGVIDDAFGSREVGGFRGHFRKLVRDRRLTTGLLKAFGGGIIGIIGGYFVSGGNAAKWAAAALLIPLSANLLNLVDLRPGRAAAVFFAGLVVTYIGAGARLSAPWLVWAIAAAALGFALSDSRGRAMMGDSGANALGAALGLTMALNTGLVLQIAAIIVFGVVHYYSEKHSITGLIERSPILRAIDSRLGVR